MNRLDIRTLGAVGDGTTLCTIFIQSAIDEMYEKGGGTVVVPPGTYVSGTLYIKSNICLHLEAGAVLKASDNLEHYPVNTWGENPGGERHKDRQPYHFIVIDHAENVTIEGKGTIDGNDKAFWLEPHYPKPWWRAKAERVTPMIDCNDSTNVTFRDFTLTRSPGWTCHINRCDWVVIDGIKIKNYVYGPNTDGIDVNGCRDVMISNCFIETGDDAIVLKTTQDSRSCERITVTNCVLKTNCEGLKLGTESCHAMKHITFSNCVVYESHRMIGLHCYDGGIFENITISNIVGDSLSPLPLTRPIQIELKRRDEQARLGQIRNVRISQVVAETKGRILITAEPGATLENITLEGITLNYSDGIEDPLPISDADTSLQYPRNNREARKVRAACIIENAKYITLRDFKVVWPKEAVKAFHHTWLNEVNGCVLDNPFAEALGDVSTYAIQHNVKHLRCAGGEI